MGSQPLKEERYADIDEIISESFTSPNMTEEKTDMVLEYLCQTISNMDSYEEVKQKATLLQRCTKAPQEGFLRYFSLGLAKRETIRPLITAAMIPTLAEESGPSRTPRSPFSATASFVPFARL